MFNSKKSERPVSVQIRGRMTGREELTRLEHKPPQLWQSETATLLLVGVLILVDAATLYSMFSRIIMDAALMLFLMTGGVAVALELIPMILGRYIACYEYRLEKPRMWKIVLLIVAFFILFAATTFLRFYAPVTDLASSSASAEVVMGMAGTEGIQSAAREEATRKLAFNLLTSILPLVTSVIALLLGMITSNPVQAGIKRLSHVKLRIETNIEECTAALAEAEVMQTYKQELLCGQQEAHQNALDQITAWEQGQKAQVRTSLAAALTGARLTSPADISELTQPLVWRNFEQKV